jgi:hypothetical protein
VSGSSSLERGPVRVVDVRRADGRVRRLTVLSPAVERWYRDAVAPVAGPVERSLGPAVFAERLGDPRTLRPLDHRGQRRRFRREVRRLVGDGGGTAMDVGACYASIAPGAVERALLLAGAHPAQVGRIVRVLDGFARAGVEGLPVGPPASAVLANAVLGRVDRAMDAAGLRWARWVDDVVVTAPPERAVETFASALAPWGLAPNAAKTCALDPSPQVRGSVW